MDGRRGVQRKVFRVEQMFAGGRAGGLARQYRAVDDSRTLPSQNDARDHAMQAMKRELADMQATLARQKQDLAALLGDAREHRMARAADELRASVDGMDVATQKILNLVELIDDSAKALASALKTEYERGLTQDIQDHVVKIYEACNFQDLSGQRISNVIGVMAMVEDRVAAMLKRCSAPGVKDEPVTPIKPDRSLLNGPKLDGDPGHASQIDIDKMFN